MIKKIPDPIDVHVGSRVRLRRMLIGMSQEKLGEALNLTFQQIQKYEKGANRIGSSRLYKISQLLGVSVQFFFDDMPMEAAGEAAGFSENDSTPMIMDFVSTPEGVQLNRAFSRIDSADVRRRVVDLVKSLAQNSESEPSD